MQEDKVVGKENTTETDKQKVAQVNPIKAKRVSKIQTIILLMVATGILGVIGITKWQTLNQGMQKLIVSEIIMEVDAGEQVYVNANQIVKFTNDGVVGYNVKGEELWRDTLNLDQLWIVQRDPYLAVTSKAAREIIIFDEKGRLGSIQVSGLLCYLSINEKGSIVVIEESTDGHRVATYTKEGKVLGASRTTYIENGGFPIVAEISPHNESLLIAYVNVSGPSITSSIISVPVKADEGIKIDNIAFGIDEKDNLIYEIEFIDEKTWVSIGDQITTFYSIDGKEIGKIEGFYATYIPYLVKRAARGQTLPIVANTHSFEATIHAKETLYFLNRESHVVESYPMENTVTFYKADDKGVIIGQGRKFTGYNKMGMPHFEFDAVQDIESITYVDRYAIAIGKTQVIRLDPVTKEEDK
jgi:hypothetical protein